MHAAKIMMSIVAVALLAACSPDTDYKDLNAFMDEVDARPRGRVRIWQAISAVRLNLRWYLSVWNVRTDPRSSLTLTA